MPKPVIIAVTLILALIAAACGSDEGSETTEETAAAVADGGFMVQDGDAVEVHYTGTLDDGSEFDSSRGSQPLAFTVASGQVIPGFDDAVRGLKVGETRVYTMPPEDAYGVWSEDNILELPYGPQQSDVQVGDQVFLSATGQPVIVLEVREDTVLVDANHQLAGEALTFDVEIVSITRP